MSFCYRFCFSELTAQSGKSFFLPPPSQLKPLVHQESSKKTSVMLLPPLLHDTSSTTPLHSSFSLIPSFFSRFLFSLL